MGFTPPIRFQRMPIPHWLIYLKMAEVSGLDPQGFYSSNRLAGDAVPRTVPLPNAEG